MAGVAATWSMPNLGQASSRVGTESFTLEATKESVMSPDLRSRVDPRDFADGGKYRSIVKLIIRYEGQTEKGHAMGTGWLITPDIMVTAGHNVFDWSGGAKGFGKAVQIKCYIGYQGSASVDTPGVQYRLAKNIVTTAEWISSRENRHRDVAFIQVDRPFDGDLRLFKYKPTPSQGHVMLGVVGYPGDKTLETDAGEERGAEMYEMFDGQEYNLDGNPAENTLRLLEYDISTYGGQSGAPVIRKDSKTMTVIGTHVYGAGTNNHASSIGKNGNDYDTMLKAFTAQLPTISESRGIKLVKLADGASNPFTPQTSTGFQQSGFTPKAAGEEEEGFFDVFRDVSRFVAGALPTVAPFLGPIGGPIAAVAGTAINALAGRAESAFDDPEAATRGITDRAVLAEAALQTVLKMEHGPVLEKVVGDMKKTYTVHAPNIKLIAPKIAPTLFDAAQTINAGGQYNYKNAGPRATLPPRRIQTDGSESAFGTSDFAAGLLQREARPLVGEEGFFDGLSTIIDTGLRIAKPLLREGAKVGLGLLSNALGAESAWDQPIVPAEHIKAAELVSKRAILGEAALQALDKLNKRELTEVRLSHDAHGNPAVNSSEEGFFDNFLNVVQKIGTVAKAAAPHVLKAVVPIVTTVLSKKSGAESLLALPRANLRKKPSLAEMLTDGSLHKLSIQDADRPNGIQQQTGPSIQVPSLEEVQRRYLVEGPDPNEDKPVFQVYDWE